MPAGVVSSHRASAGSDPPHQQRGRQQHTPAIHAPEDEARDALRGAGQVKASHERHRKEHEQAEHANPQLEGGIYLQGMPRPRDEPRERGAAHAQPSHVGRQQ
jgi:hypothetical protein